jgi:hypothetical protein
VKSAVGIDDLLVGIAWCPAQPVGGDRKRGPAARAPGAERLGRP